MITLYQFPPFRELPNLSPFCMKLETYLRMVEIPFELARHADIRKAPLGKFHYIVEEDKTIADTDFIIEYLKEKHGDPLDHLLDDTEKAIALAMRRLFEESLYWTMIYDRWVEIKNWKKLKSEIFSSLPIALKIIVPPVLRKKMISQLKGHGRGLHPKDHIYRLGKADLKCIVDFLKEKPFFMGKEPTSLDATAYGFLAHIVWTPFESPLKNYALQFPQLTQYCERMKERFYAS